MPLSKNINTYADVQAILDQIIPHKTGTYRLPTPGKARNWQMRAYQFRKLYQEAARARASVKGYTPNTPYDMMRITLSANACLIDFAPEPEGTLSLPTGEVIKPVFNPTIEHQAPAEQTKPEFAPRVVAEKLDSLSEAAATLLSIRGEHED